MTPDRLQEIRQRYQKRDNSTFVTQMEDDMRFLLNELATAEAEGRQQGNWQSINTAPTDGQLVLLHPSRCWVEDVNCDAEVGYWDNVTQQWIAEGPIAEDYEGPTHWMPLPSPPVRQLLPTEPQP